ncbi:MAG: M48 family metallopeptidase [Vicinamibacterales bacterium]
MQLGLPWDKAVEGEGFSPRQAFSPGQPVFVRHRWARRYILRVLDDGTLRVTLPRWGSKREALLFVEQSEPWIARQRHTKLMAPSAGRPDEPALRALALKELPPALLALAAQHGITVTRVSIRNQRSRWGACSASGSITLNWRLVLVPEFVREYVMLHELMHRRELNHSRRFWRQVASVCPRHREARQWLLADGQQLF